jgi:hypothetical protein
MKSLLVATVLPSTVCAARSRARRASPEKSAGRVIVTARADSLGEVERSEKLRHSM